MVWDSCRVQFSAIEIVAHRGGPDEGDEPLPEHSLAAYLRAIDCGADALEFDVRLTADGHLVCIHDRRVDRTSNGRGVVSTMTLAQLQSMDFGDERDAHDRTRSGVLTLDTLLDAAMSRSSTIRFAIETKHPSRYGGDVERALLATLQRHALDAQRVRIMSFSALAIGRVRRLAPQLPRVLLMEYVMWWQRGGRLPGRPDAVAVSVELIRRHPNYVPLLLERGHPVHVWTVDDPGDVLMCAQLGASVIITNRPGLAREVLKRAELQ